MSTENKKTGLRFNIFGADLDIHFPWVHPVDKSREAEVKKLVNLFGIFSVGILGVGARSCRITEL
jgi:hypothetical protein